MTFPTQCPCGAELRVLHRGCRTWTATCPNCYDPTEGCTAVERVMGRGDTAEQAVQDFHERREEAA